MLLLLTPQAITALIAGYLLGSIPFGLIVARVLGLGDLRQIGSGNIGATNVLRAGGWGPAFLTFLLDAGKGTAAVLLANSGLLGTLPPAFLPYFALIGAIVGHMFPVWLGFRGGKSVATYLGGLAGLYWPLAAIFALTWLLVAGVTRISSVSALTALVAVPMGTYALGQPALAFLLVFPAILIGWAHRKNIARLLSGTEPRIGG